MGSATVVPISTGLSSAWNIVGAATAHAALADASDATYVACDASTTHTLEVVLGDALIPAGAAIRRVTPTVRLSSTNVGYRPAVQVFRRITPTVNAYQTPKTSLVPTVAIATRDAGAGGVMISAPAGQPTYTPVNVGSQLILRVELTTPSLAPPNLLKIYLVSALVEWDEQPTVSGLAFNPAGAATLTGRPPLIWAYSDPEGTAQQASRVVVWHATDGADPLCPGAATTSFVAGDGTTRTAVAQSGTAADPSVAGSTATWAPAEPLVNGAYRWFVQVADRVGGTTRWADAQAHLDATVAVTALAPPPPALTGLVWDSTAKRASFLAVVAGNLLTADEAGHEDGAAGSWVAHLNAGAPAVDATWAASGANARTWTATAAGDSAVRTSSAAPATAGDPYSGHARVRVAAGTLGFTTRVRWLNAAGAALSESTPGPVVVAGSGGATAVVENKVAPAGAVAAQLIVTAVGAAAGQQLWTDEDGLYPGATAPAAWTGGGMVASQRIVPERSVDGGTTWRVVPSYGPGEPADAGVRQRVTIIDGSLRHGLPVAYRARVVAVSGAYDVASAYTTAAGSVTPVVDGFLLRDPADRVTGPMRLSIGGSLPMPSEERLGVFDVPGFDRPVFVSAGFGGEQYEVTLTVEGQAAMDALRELRRRRKSLVLQSDMTGIAWWVRFGAKFSPTLLNSTSRRDDLRRPYTVQATLIEVYGPDLQIGVP